MVSFEGKKGTFLLIGEIMNEMLKHNMPFVGRNKIICQCLVYWRTCNESKCYCLCQYKKCRLICINHPNGNKHPIYLFLHTF